MSFSLFRKQSVFDRHPGKTTLLVTLLIITIILIIPVLLDKDEEARIASLKAECDAARGTFVMHGGDAYCVIMPRKTHNKSTT